MEKKLKLWIFGIILFYLILCISLANSDVAQLESSNSKDALSELGITGMKIINFSVDNQKTDDLDFKSGVYDLKNEFSKTTFMNQEKVKQDIYLKNNQLSNKDFNFSIIIEIDYSEIRWNGTRYILTNNPIKLTSWIEKGELIAPQIWMDDKYHKRIDYKDIAEIGGYAKAYEFKGKYFVELKIDKLNVLSKENYYIDPEYANMTDGFDIGFAGITNARGITTNDSDFWIIDNVLIDFVYHFDAEGNNITDGFEIKSAGVGFIEGITTNGSDFWVVSNFPDFVYHFDSSGNNITDGFEIGSAGAGSPQGITTNGSDFWIADNLDDFVYHFNSLGVNQTDGFDIKSAGAESPQGITTNGSDIWVIDSDSIVADDFVYHFNLTGTNITDGFDTGFVSISLDGITTNGSDFWLVEDFNNFLYHFSEDLENPDIKIIFPTNDTNSTDNNLNVNYTVSDDIGLASCWYSNDTFSTNTTIACGTNITTITWVEGQHNVTVWTRDLANNENSSSVTFKIDTIPPNVTIAEPQEKNYADNNTIYLNYSVSDATLEVDSCWYYIINETGNNQTANVTIANCLNTTFGLPSGDIDYTLTLFANDSNNNLNFTENVTFGIRTNVPTISLDSPTDNQFFDNGTDIYFNFTATDSEGLDTCDLYGNWTGTWHKNFTWVKPTNATQNFTNVNLTDGPYIWNVGCNDTLNNRDFALNNFTVNIDTIFPNVSITTTNGTVAQGLIITINYLIQDRNIDTCFFTLRDSDGNPHNFPENTTLTCGDTSRAVSTLSFGTFTFEIFGRDLAGNENSSIITFTTQVAEPTGGGGARPSTVSKIAIKQPNVTQQSDLKRAILFSRIFEACGNNPNIIGICRLNLQQKNELIINLSEQTVEVNLDELNIWLENFNNFQFEEVQVSPSDVERFNLFVGVLADVTLEITPRNLDPIPVFLIREKPIARYQIRSNRVLRNATIIEGDLGLRVELISDTVAEVILEPVDLDFSSRIFSATISYVDERGGSAFQNVNIRAINLRHPTTLIVIGIGIVIIIILIYKKSRKRIIKFGREIIKNIRKLFR